MTKEGPKPTTKKDDVSKETNPQDDISTQFEKLQDSNKDFQKFLSMLADAGELAADQSIGIEEQQKIINSYNIWIEAGKPKTRMPSISSDEVPIPDLIVRVKLLGKQFLYWRDTKNKVYGMELMPVYGTRRDNDPQSPTFGKDVEDRDHIVDEKERYTVPYDRKNGVELVNAALKLHPTPQFVFSLGSTGTSKYSVTPEDFNVPGPDNSKTFDDIINLHKKKDYIL